MGLYEFGTDAGPPCSRCGGTVYSYRVTDGPDRPEAQCCGLTVRCVGCHFTAWYEPGPGDAKPTTATEARALHEKLAQDVTDEDGRPIPAMRIGRTH